MTELSSDIVYFVLITGRKQKDALLTALLECGGKLVNTMYGKGSVKHGYIMDFLGFVPEENKVVITCLMTSESSGDALKMLVEKFHFDKPNTGIAFTVPVEKI